MMLLAVVELGAATPSNNIRRRRRTTVRSITTKNGNLDLGVTTEKMAAGTKIRPISSATTATARKRGLGLIHRPSQTSSDGNDEEEKDIKLDFYDKDDERSSSWWEYPNCVTDNESEDMLEVIMFLNVDYVETEQDLNYDSGLLIYERNSDEAVALWDFRDPNNQVIHDSKRFCLEDSQDKCYEMYWYYLGGEFFPPRKGGLYVDVNGNNILDIRGDQGQYSDIYGRVEFFGGYFGSGCESFYGNDERNGIVTGHLNDMSNGAGGVIENNAELGPPQPTPPNENSGEDALESNFVNGTGSGDRDVEEAPELIRDRSSCYDEDLIQIDMHFNSDKSSEEDNEITLRIVEDDHDDNYTWKYPMGSFRKDSDYRWSTCVDEKECNEFTFYDKGGT